MVKALPFWALRFMTWIGLTSLMLVVLAATPGLAIAGSSATIVTALDAAPASPPERGNPPPPVRDQQQLRSSCSTTFAFTQAVDEQQDDDPVLDVALDVAGWRLVTTRTVARVHSDATGIRATQVVLRARPARGPPV